MLSGQRRRRYMGPTQNHTGKILNLMSQVLKPDQPSR